MDEDLIARSLAGEPEAFRRLIDLYDAAAQRTALAFLQERGAAEDAVQEAWIDAWRSLARFTRGRPFRPWLLTLVINRCRMKTRRRRFLFVPFAQALPALEGRASDDDPAALLAGGDPALAEALAALDDDLRRLLALRFYADLELAEVAQVLGLPLGTVKSRLSRALKQLRERLGPEAAAHLGRAEGIQP